MPLLTRLLLAFACLATVVRAQPAPAALPPAAPTDTIVRYLSGHGIDDAVPWDFSITGGRRAGEQTKIPVPWCWELQGFGTYAYGRGTPESRTPPTEQGKYGFTFDVPAAWQGRVVRLVFDGAMTDTEAWINGQSAGPVHQGAFYRFRYDITPLVKFGASNRLEVTVSKESANASVNNAERRGDYWNFGGIFRPVWLEVLPAQFIERTAIDARADGSFAADVFLGPGVAAGRVSAQIVDAQNRPVDAPFTADVAAGAEKVALHAQIDHPALWTAETPNLYRVRLTLATSGGAPVHTLSERFGFRTFEVRAGDGFYLNGQKIVLKGVCRHSFWPESGRALSPRLNYADVRFMKDANMNAVRMSHYPPDQEFLEACDELGMYVLDELGGWQKGYDTPTGQRLIGEMVRRDVNHPAILIWDNGNEGGWNAANDGEFAKWDPQQRIVIHPWAKLGAVDDRHYPVYSDLAKLDASGMIFTATEILHSLYDGGGGSGLHDYWAALSKAPHFGGAFFWMLADEGVMRTDQNNRLDVAGNLDADGISGPHREPEGSYFTIKQIWSPVQVGGLVVEDGVQIFPTVENHYDFTNLKQCTFSWSLAAFPTPGATAGHQVLASGEIAGPDIAPHASGRIVLPAGAGLVAGRADILYLTVKNPQGQALWTWSFPRAGSDTNNLYFGPGSPNPREENGQIIIGEGQAPELRFDKATGLLVSVSRGGQKYPLGAGPRFIAQELASRSSMRVGTPSAFRDLAGESTLVGISARTGKSYVIVEATYRGPLQNVTWLVAPDGEVQLDYTYSFDGTVDMLGVNFDCDQSAIKGVTYLGWGPYRSWQNRIEGTTFDVWHTAHNDTVPGVSWNYPEFQGYFRGVRWATLDTTAGPITITRKAAGPTTFAGNAADLDKSFFGLFTPHDAPAKDGPLMKLPETGIAFLDVIPAMRDKFKVQSQIGPQSAPQTVSGVHEGHVTFSFGPPK